MKKISKEPKTTHYFLLDLQGFKDHSFPFTCQHISQHCDIFCEASFLEFGVVHAASIKLLMETPYEVHDRFSCQQ